MKIHKFGQKSLFEELNMLKIIKTLRKHEILMKN